MARTLAASSTDRGRLLGAVLAATIVSVLSAQPAQAETPPVAMRGLAFVPATVAVQQVAGEPGFPEAHGHVVWTNEDPDTVHTVTFDDPRLVSSGRLATGQRHEAVLSLTGSFTYRCTIHPSMTGTLEVAPAAAGTATTLTTAQGPPTGDGDGGSDGGAALVVRGVGLAAAVGLGWFLVRRRLRPARPGGDGS